MIVKFLKDTSGFDRGDVVEVADEVADKLIEAGAAEQYQAPAPAPKADKPAKPGK